MKFLNIFILIFLVTGLLGNLVFIGYSSHVDHDSLTIKAETKLQKIVDDKAQLVTEFLQTQESILQDLLDEEVFAKIIQTNPQNFNYQSLLQKTLTTLDESPAISAGFSGLDGIIIASKSRNLIGHDISTHSSPDDVPNFHDFQKPSYQVYSDRTPLSLFLGLASFIFDPITDEPIGTLGIRVSLTQLQQLVDITDLSDLEQSSEIYLINENALLLTPSKFIRGDNKGVLTQTVDTQNSQLCFHHYSQEPHKPHMDHSQSKDSAIFLDYKGEDVIGAHYSFTDPDWCLLAEMNKYQAVDIPFKSLLKKNIFISLGIILSMILISVLIGIYLDTRFTIGHRSPRKYPCGLRGNLRPLYCRLVGAACHTFPRGLCGKTNHFRHFFSNLSTKFHLLLGALLGIIYIIIITLLIGSFHADYFLAILSSWSLLVVSFAIFSYGISIKNLEIRKPLLWGAGFLIIHNLILLPLEEYWNFSQSFNPTYWAPIITLEFIGFLLLLLFLKQSSK